MPYARTSTGYPVQMKQIIEDVADDMQARVITASSEKEARGIRSKFYQFLGACKRDVTVKPDWFDDRDLAGIKQFLLKFMSVEIRLEGCEVIFQPRDSTAKTAVFDNVRIRELKEETQHVPADEQSGKLSPMEESAARLMAAQQKKFNKGE